MYVREGRRVRLDQRLESPELLEESLRRAHLPPLALAPELGMFIVTGHVEPAIIRVAHHVRKAGLRAREDASQTAVVARIMQQSELPSK